ncbi:response regulator transcription factor [Pontivivens insulae]|uniref:Sensory transduction protein regX3 n=1 Tax=Pontivivens insulae TaxID=1639689 RepID=A0A2R8A8C3_9RHOB|nr:response regulator transcription factor [Pontivivens insulae]RED18382.1 two-component system OmpR family response regulator [Pontivivens insulae]SPF28280.1 Sensory transduction protein regX3 [Pontivivens insulae]
MKILIVDDDPRLRELVSIASDRAGFDVSTAGDGATALIQAEQVSPDLIVLDIGLPELDGFEVFRRIRGRADVPILFLTARDEEIDRVLGLELGADDYVTKPFSPRELVARIRTILRRSQPSATAAADVFGPLRIDRARHSVHVDGAPVALTGTEFALLGQLMENPGQLCSRAQLVAGHWGPRSLVSDRTLDSHLRNLRLKLADAGVPEMLETVHGVGLRLRSGQA